MSRTIRRKSQTPLSSQRMCYSSHGKRNNGRWVLKEGSVWNGEAIVTSVPTYRTCNSLDDILTYHRVRFHQDNSPIIATSLQKLYRRRFRCHYKRQLYQEVVYGKECLRYSIRDFSFRVW